MRNVVVILALLCATGCGGDSPVEPEPLPQEPQPAFSGQISESVTAFGHVDAHATVECLISDHAEGIYTPLVVRTGDYQAPTSMYCLRKYTLVLRSGVYYPESHLSIQNGDVGWWYQVWVEES